MSVARDERVEPRVVVGQRAEHRLVLVELLEAVEHGAHVLRVAHVDVRAVQHRDDVAVHDAEPLGEPLRGAIGLAARHVDPAGEQLLGDVRAVEARRERADRHRRDDRARARAHRVRESRERAHAPRFPPPARARACASTSSGTGSNAAIARRRSPGATARIRRALNSEKLRRGTVRS